MWGCAQQTRSGTDSHVCLLPREKRIRFSLCKHCVQGESVCFGEQMTLLRMRWSFSLSDSLILKMFPLPRWVRVSPSVEARTAGVEFRFGPAESRFPVVHPHRPTHLPPAAGAAASREVDQDPCPQHVGEPGSCLSFSSSRLWNARRHPKRASPNLRWGREVTSRKTCTFLRTNAMQPNKGVAAASSQGPRPPSRRALPDPFGADLPKAMPYWFCTNRVHV